MLKLLKYILMLLNSVAWECVAPITNKFVLRRLKKQMDALEEIIEKIDLFLNQLPFTQDSYKSCNEHDILQYLNAEEIQPFSQLDIRQSKDLFSAHFLCMHALYHLQNRCFQNKAFHLEITATKITRLPYQAGESGISHTDPLKTYYLDIKHYFETSEDEINQLLNDFWKKFLSQDDKAEALATLELPKDSNYEQVKKQYRLLAQKHHPDKGGSSEYFAKVNAAKSLLDNAFSQR